VNPGGGPDRWPWLARLWLGDTPVGAGFLVDERRVLTCAHVVADVLGAGAPDGRVVLDFPAWTGQGVGRLGAAVEPGGWFPVGADESGDLAVLRLEADLPEAMVRAPLRRPASLLDHRFRCHGFPPEPPGGREAAGVLRGPAGPGWEWVQLEAQGAQGYAVERGFSGAPVWDEQAGAVVGMVVAQDPRSPTARVGWMIPVDVLARRWAPLESLTLAGDVAGRPGASLTLLHLSDVRFGRHVPARAGAPAADRRLDALFARLHDDLGELRARDGLAPDLVVVSGGLADRGLRSEFQQAHRFLEELRRVLDLPSRRFIVVPGGHDVNRKACEAYFLRCEADQEEPVPPFWPKWEQFAAMLGGFHRGEPALAFPVDEPWGLVELPELRVVVAALNSTMAESHRDADHHGWVGEAQLHWFAERLRQPERRRWLRVGVVHHDVLRGAPDDEGNLRDADDLDRLLAPHLDLLLHGRSHTARLGHLAGGLPVLPAGSAAPGPDGRQRGVADQYQAVRVGPDAITRWARRYEPELRRWTGDTRVSDDGRDWRATVSVALGGWAGELSDDRPIRGVDAELGRLRDDFLDRVAEVCRLRDRDAEVTRVRSTGSGLDYLRVTVPGDLAARQRPVGACAGGASREEVERFAAEVHDRYREADPLVQSELVYGGERASDALVELARRRGVHLVSFMEYQGLLDLRGYVHRLRGRLLADPLYPPGLYVRQRYAVQDGDGTVRDDVLAALVGWLGSWQGRFVLVLGSFGTGKTFLLRELARRLPDELPDLVPVLIELGGLQKASTLDELVAAHMAAAGEDTFSLARFRYMLREGRIALLFDGYDELALRVTYDRAAEHLQMLISAADGQAKVVVTSRTQHFVSEHQVRTALGARVDLLPGRRVVQLQDLDQAGIRDLLVKRFQGDEERADRLLDLIAGVRDLPELSRNPRLLSFMSALDEEQLRQVREHRAGLSAAELYRLLLQRWLEHEYTRSHPRGAAPSLSVEDRWRAATHLALELWLRPEGALPVAGLTAALAAAVDQLPALRMDPAEVVHAVGSGTLLVRDEEGSFRFVHRSVMEWLVANHAAGAVRSGVRPDVLDRREASPLMAEFFADLAGRDLATAWARERLGSGTAAEVAKRNALLVLDRLGERPAEPARLAEQNLRGADLAGRDLRWSDLHQADLSHAQLAGARLQLANLAGAILTGASLDGADLREADLSGADLTAARLLGADLRGAKLEGSRWVRSAVAGARLDPRALDGLDTWGAALPDGEVRTQVHAGRQPVASVAFSPDGQLVACGGADGVVLLWDVRTRRQLRALTGHRGGVWSLAFSPDGGLLASGGSDRTVLVRDVESGREVGRLVHRGDVRSVAFLSDGRRLATGGGDGVALWDVATGQLVAHLEGHVGAVHGVAVSSDGRRLASGGDDTAVLLWDMESGREVARLDGHRSEVQSVAFTPDGRRLASAGRDWAVLVWDVESGRLVHRLEGHADWVRTVAFSRDGLRLASGGDDGDRAVLVWDAESGRQVHRLEGHAGAVRCLAFGSDGRLLATGGEDSTVLLWDVESGHQAGSLSGRAAWVLSVALSPDGRRLASSGEDGAVLLWDAVSGRLDGRLEGHSRPVRSVALSPDGLRLASGGDDGVLAVWDVEGGHRVRRLRRLEGHAGGVRSVAYGADRRRLASGGDDAMVVVWDPESGRSLHRLEGHARAVRSVAYRPDGLALASGDGDGVVLVWDPVGGRRVGHLEGHREGVRRVAYSPDGRRLASGDSEGTVLLWDAGTGRRVGGLQGLGGVRSVAYSADSRRLAAGGDDGGVLVWDAAGGSPAVRLEGHSGGVWGVAFSPDGRRLWSGAVDGSVRCWDVEAGGGLLATLLPLADGWACLLPDGSYKLEGSPADEFWYVSGLCRFEPGQLDRYVPSIRRLPADAPIPSR
jgi:WD40 repeat protein/3',5'-cyclic AMP phosphodiesterase CpdA